MKKTDSFTPEDIKAFEPEAKVGLLGTVTPDGQPHLTLISSIRAKSPQKLIWGQFSEGASKKHVRDNPKAAFLVLTMDKRLWRGKAVWTHSVSREGDDFEMYNNQPMFRYNAYFGIHTVHYMDLVETGGEEKTPPGPHRGLLPADQGGRRRPALGPGSDEALGSGAFQQPGPRSSSSPTSTMTGTRS